MYDFRPPIAAGGGSDSRDGLVASRYKTYSRRYRIKAVGVKQLSNNNKKCHKKD
jgi:hypothetical protein